MKTDPETLRQEQQSLTRRLDDQKRLLVQYREEMALAGPEERARLTVRCEKIEREIQADEARLIEIADELAAPDLNNEAQTSSPATRPSNRKPWGLGGTVLLLLAIAAIAASRLIDRAAPTPTPAATPAPAATPTPADLALLPTSTPLVGLPVAVGLELSGCEASKGRLQDEIAAGGGKVVAAADAEMQIAASCSDDAITLDIRFPPRPAYRIEWVDEPPLLSLQTQIAYGRTFLRAAVAYAAGRYRQSGEALSPVATLVASPEVALLLGQALLHDEQWDKARAAFGRALELERAAGARAELMAPSEAGIGIAHALEAQLVRTAAARQACLAQAAGHFDAAIALQPDRALWRLGRARALELCPYTDVDAALLRQDVEPFIVADQSTASPPTDQALALAMMAHILFNWEDTPDESRARDLAERAIDLAPELPSAYRVLQQIADGQNDVEEAERLLRSYLERLALPGQRARVLQR
jgi:tetratricopeptide (TPR) repeat protein